MGKKVDHFSHREHALELVASKNVESVNGGIHCALCNSTKRTSNDVYACKSCHYYLDPFCARLQENIAVGGHQEHQLTLVTQAPTTETESFSSPKSMVCRACGLKISGWRYACTPCRYDVHVMCAILPQASKFKHHRHELSLDFPGPQRGFVNCDLCGQGDHGFWGYSCKHCKKKAYYLHLDCTPFKDPSSSSAGTITEAEDKGHLKGLLTKMEHLELKLKSTNVGAAVALAGGVGVLAHGLEKIHQHRAQKKNKKKGKGNKGKKGSQEEEPGEEEGQNEDVGEDQEEGSGSGEEEEDPFEIGELGSEGESLLGETSTMFMEMASGLGEAAAGAGDILAGLLEGLGSA